MLNPKTVLINGMSKAIKSALPMVEPLKFDYVIGDKFIFENTTTLTLGDYTEELKIWQEYLDKMQINMNAKFDRSNKKALVNTNIYIPDVNVSYDYFINDKENYMFLNEIYDKYIKLEDIQTDYFNNKITIQDIMYIYTKAYDSFNNNIKEEWITREFSLDKEPIVTSKLVITKDDYIEVLKNVRNDLLNDSKVIEILELLNIKDEELEEIKNENITADFEKLTITAKQSIIKNTYSSVEISKDALSHVFDKDKYEFVDKIVNEKILYENKDSKISVKMFDDNELDGSFDITYDNKNFELKVIDADGVNVATLKGQDNNNNYVYTLTMPIEDYNYETNEDEIKNFEISFGIKYEEAKDLKYNATLGIKYDDIDVLLSSNGRVSQLTEDINVDTSNYVIIDNVDEDAISNKLYEKLNQIKIFKDYNDRIDSVVTGSINESKENAIYTEAKSLVTKYSNKIIEDSLLPKEQQKLTNIDTKVTSNWKCLGDSSFSTDLINVLEVTSEDYILKGNVIKGDPTTSNVTNKTCSAIRKNGSRVEILLVANPTGRFGLSNNEVLYGWSFNKQKIKE